MLGGGAGFDFPRVTCLKQARRHGGSAGQRNGTVAQNLTVYVLCVL